LWVYERTGYDPAEPIYLAIQSPKSVYARTITSEDGITYYRVFKGFSLWTSSKHPHYAAMKEVMTDVLPENDKPLSLNKSPLIGSGYDVMFSRTATSITMQWQSHNPEHPGGSLQAQTEWPSNLPKWSAEMSGVGSGCIVDSVTNTKGPAIFYAFVGSLASLRMPHQPLGPTGVSSPLDKGIMEKLRETPMPPDFEAKDCKGPFDLDQIVMPTRSR
jgi:hypothetical protein